MINNPFFYIRIWKSQANTVIGTRITIDEYKTSVNRGFKLWAFTGRTATVCVVTEEKDIERIHALDFATLFMKGRYVTITVDLANLTSTSTIGNPPPCY